MKKEEFPSTNCVGVVTVRWSVRNGGIKPCTSSALAFVLCTQQKSDKRT